jgi:flagellar hook-associated protein 1 FlgK
MGILNIGISGLNAAQAGISTTSHNISNVNTGGYSRQTTVQTTNTPQFTGVGYLGQGTSVSTIKRLYDGFLATQTREAQSQSSQLTMLSGQLSNIDNLLADTTVGLAPVMDSFFGAVNTLASNPSDAAARQSLISAGQSMATRFRDLSAQLTTLREQANANINQSVSGINSLAAQVASLNNSVAAALGSGKPPNDLLDQRDALLLDLSKQTRVSVVPLADGTVNVFMNSGQALVLGNTPTQLQVQSDPANPQNLTVGINANGNFQQLAESTLAGGELGGSLAFRTALDGAENGLGRIAIELAQSFNAQHSAGQDLNGNLGTNFFAAGTPQSLVNANNTGNASLSVSISNYGALTTADYRLAYDGTNYVVTNQSTKQQQTFATLPQTVDGVSIGIASGTMNAGDSFLIQPTRAGATGFSSLITDPSRVAAALPVRASVANANTGSGTATVTAVTPPPGANLQQPVSIVFTSATTFNVVGTGTGNPTGLSFTPGMQVSYNGWTMTLDGTPASGDTFSVGANTGGSGDNGNAIALGSLQTAKLLNGGTAGLNEAYAQLVSDVGNQTRAAKTGADAQKVVLTNAQSAQQAVSGVSLDEEAANLLKYQQAYQAASKIISTANTVFDSILSILK